MNAKNITKDKIKMTTEKLESSFINGKGIFAILSIKMKSSLLSQT